MEIDNEVMAESKENHCDSSADEHEKNLAHHRELYYSEHLDHNIDENSANSLPDEDDIEHPQYFVSQPRIIMVLYQTYVFPLICFWIVPITD